MIAEEHYASRWIIHIIQSMNGLAFTGWMISMRFKGLDLNLLVALDALLETRSVARTAERVGLSQPATSAALARLRQFFGDDLLIAEGRRYHLTAAARALRPLVRQCLSDAEQIVTVSGGFDPSTSVRDFRVVASDYSAVAVLTRLAANMASRAPNIALDIIPPEYGSPRQFEDGTIDIFIGPQVYLRRDQPTEFLYEERYVITGWAENPVFQRPLTLEDIEGADFVSARFGPDRFGGWGEQHLEALGITRRIEIGISSFATVPWFLPGTMRLALMHERLARFFGEVAPLRWSYPPFEVPTLRVLAQHHRSRSDDPGVLWLREQIRMAVQDGGIPA